MSNDPPAIAVPMTWEKGPNDPAALADGPGTFVEVDIDATAEAIWLLVTDINFGAAFSDEFQSAGWAAGVDGPTLGAEFIGTNKNDFMGTWEVSCFINRYQENKEFGWVTTSLENPGARWRFELEEAGGSTKLRYSVALGPGPSGLSAFIASQPDMEERAIKSRLRALSKNMLKVAEGIKAALAN
jgi:hypothetical protein